MTRVCGGTLNLDGAVVVELTASPRTGTIQRLIRAVNEARAQKGRYERLAERSLDLVFRRRRTAGRDRVRLAHGVERFGSGNSVRRWPWS